MRNKLVQAVRETFKNPNNEQIKHLAQAFRIGGVAGFLGVITASDNTSLDVAALVLGWVTLECCAIIVLRFLSPDMEKKA